MYKKRGGFKKTYKKKNSKKAHVPAKKATVALIKKVVHGEAETKYRVHYGGATTAGVTDGGLYVNSGFYAHNQRILVNATDIHRLIPRVFSGTGDGQRIGCKITPISLMLRGNVMVNPANVAFASSTLFPQDLVAVIYILQHVSLKDYTNLSVANDFRQLLDVGEQQTLEFSGSIQKAQMPVAKQYYKLHKKMVLPLRFGGDWHNPSSSATGLSITPTKYTRDFTVNLTGMIPKVLQYSEVQTSTSDPFGDPTNSSLFMSVGFYFMNAQTPTDVLGIAIEYQSQLRYKDI